MQQLLPLVWFALAVAARLQTVEPPIEDTLAFQLARFPWPVVVEQNAELATAHWQYVQANGPLNVDRAWWHDYQREAAYRASVWGMLRQAQTEAFHEDCRWQSLDALWDLLGEEDYTAGRLPLPMPCMDWWAWEGRRARFPALR